MIPRHIEVVDRIPFTEAGKIDRRAVAARLAGHAECTRLSRHRSGGIGAGGDRRDCARLPRLGVDDDFFGLGGDSVLATKAVARIRHGWTCPTSWSPTSSPAEPWKVWPAAPRTRTAERLDQIAELYLEVIDMDTAEVALALTTETP